MKTKIYLDFDSTLFNSDQYDSDLLAICKLYRIDESQFNDIKNQLFKKNTDFDIDEFINYLIKKEYVDKSILVHIELLKNRNFIYEDTIFFLDNLKDKYDLILLTRGQEKNQQDKIRASRLEKYFSKIIITSNDKSKLDNVDYQNSIFIDNNPLEIERFISAKAKRVIRIKRNTDKYSNINLTDSKLETYTNLKDILKVL